MTSVTLSDCPHSPTHDYADRHICRAERYAAAKEKPGRIRHVVPSSEVPHLWAHCAQSDARTSRGNLFFDGNVIFSYGRHFPIARHVANKSGKTAVLFTTATYSVTTAGHCSSVRSAISHLTVFHVPDVWADTREKHHTNLRDYAERISKTLLRTARARKNKEWDHKRALELRTEATAYAKFFGLKYADVLPKVPALDSIALQTLKKIEDKRIAAERARVLKENADAIARWRNGEHVSLPHGLPDLLRIRSFPEAQYAGESGDSVYVNVLEIETSRGARFPISHAKRGLALVRAVRERGETWHTNGHTCKLGHYQIDSILPDGTVKAGCHTVKWSEINRIAAEIDAAPSVLESLDTQAS